jgi:hypothetical protein
MDARNVRVFRAYEEAVNESNNIYIDEEARMVLGTPEWGTEVTVIGRRKKRAIIKPLKELDSNGQLTRMSEALRNDLMIEVGEEVLVVQE